MVGGGGAGTGNISQQRQLRRHQVSSDISALLAAPRNVLPSEKNILQNKNISLYNHNCYKQFKYKHWSYLNKLLKSGSKLQNYWLHIAPGQKCVE